MKVGRPDENDTKLGALISKEHLEKVTKFSSAVSANKRANYENFFDHKFIKPDYIPSFLVFFRKNCSNIEPPLQIDYR